MDRYDSMSLRCTLGWIVVVTLATLSWTAQADSDPVEESPQRSLNLLEHRLNGIPFRQGIASHQYSCYSTVNVRLDMGFIAMELQQAGYSDMPVGCY